MEQAQEVRKNVFEKIGRIAQAIGSPSRLKMIQILAQAPRTVESLSQLSGESVANTSQHLQRLLREGLVDCVKDGQSRIYRISNPHLLSLWEDLQNLAHEVSPELDQAEATLTDPELQSELSAAEVIEKVRQKKVVLVDVRDEHETSASTVEFALSIPLNQLPHRMKELKKSVPIVLFCRGRYCSMASKAVRELRAEGFKASRLRESAFVLNKLWEAM